MQCHRIQCFGGDEHPHLTHSFSHPLLRQIGWEVSSRAAVTFNYWTFSVQVFVSVDLWEFPFFLIAGGKTIGQWVIKKKPLCRKYFEFLGGDFGFLEKNSRRRSMYFCVCMYKLVWLLKTLVSFWHVLQPKLVPTVMLCILLDDTDYTLLAPEKSSYLALGASVVTQSKNDP